MKKFAVTLLIAVVAMSVGVVYADSSECGGAPAVTTGDPTTGAGSVVVCVAGAPVSGSAEISGDANTQTGYVDVDGDESNAAVNECADGYVRVNSDQTINSAPDGEWDEDAEAKDLAGFLEDLQADCAPA